MLTLPYRLQWGVEGLARLLDVAHTIGPPIAAGLAMYATVTGMRTVLTGLPSLYRLPTLIVAGAVYLALVALPQPELRGDLRRLVATSRS